MEFKTEEWILINAALKSVELNKDYEEMQNIACRIDKEIWKLIGDVEVTKEGVLK
jgi:hypothetical protein